LLGEGSVYGCAVEQGDRLKALETLRDRFLAEKRLKNNPSNLVISVIRNMVGDAHPTINYAFRLGH